MNNRSRIAEPSGQDQTPAHAAQAGWGHKRWLPIAAASVAVLALAGWVIAGWIGGGRSFDGSRLRIAEVKRGDLVRDLSADGRVIAANSPTLYAIAGGTVVLKVVAGDVVTKDQPLAVIDSPELRSRLAQEQSALASLQQNRGQSRLFSAC